MLHLGDITKINGADVPMVNVIIGGSPCQDLSVAGKRAGLSGERSGLFMEQLRIIKEMRRKDIENGAVIPRPRDMVWENVPGAFSSNKGHDFKTVLEETIGVVTEVKPDIPIPKEGWHYSGCIMGEGFSLAWRVFDAQFWGVPQRRRRIALVADFGGESAPEILFERKGVSGNITQSATPWKDFAANLENRFGKSNKNNDVKCDADQKTYCIQGNAIDRADTAGCNGHGWTGGVSYTLNTVDHPTVYDIGNGQADQTSLNEKAGTINCMHDQRAVLVVRERCGCDGGGKGCLIQNNKSGTLAANNDQFIYSIDRADTAGAVNCMHDQQAIIVSDQPVGALCARDYKGVGNQYVDEGKIVISKEPSAVCTQSSVRRLTPLECERLQGFPDGWTDIGNYTDTNGKKRKTSDTARYKALGNSIALPPWAWLLERLNRYCTEHTMASLFDGIGGFPLIWETLNGKGACLWASEIDEFPIAVTKHHFS